MHILNRMLRGYLLNQLGAEGNAAAGSAGGNSAAGGDAAAQGGSAAGGAAGGSSSATGTGGQASGQAGNGQGAKTFTQEEVNRIAATAREEGRKSASNKAAEGQDPKKDDKPPAGDKNPDVAALAQQAVTAALQAAGLDPFSIAARQAGYSAAQVELARGAHDAAKPPDLGKWLTEWPTQVGITIKQGGGQAGPTAAASTGGAPRKVEDLRDEAGLVDVFSLTPEQVLAMGPTKIREEFEKTLAVARERSGAPPLPAALRRKQ
jgi:hypothetical protein